LLWTTGRSPWRSRRFQDRQDSGLDLVTAAAIRLADGTPATLALSGVSPGSLFELTFFGERGRLRATDETLVEERGAGAGEVVALPGPSESIDGNFVAAVVRRRAPVLPGRGGRRDGPAAGGDRALGRRPGK